MPKPTYDWHGADVAIRNALHELFNAQRHCNHRKRVNALNDLLAAEADIVKARQALESSQTAQAERTR